MRHRSAAVVASRCAAIVTGLAITTAACTGGHPAANASRTPTSKSARQSVASAPPAFRPSDAMALTRALASGDRQQVTGAIVLPAGPDVGSSVIGRLRRCRVTFQASTFVAAGDGTGTVQAVVTSGRTTQHWQVGLAWVTGAWKITSTVKDRG